MQSASSIDALFDNDYNNYYSGNSGFTESTIISESMRKYYHDYWEILHLIGYLYPEHPTHLQKVQIEILFHNMTNGGIPCNTCTVEFKNFLKENNLHRVCRNKTNLKKFMIDLHNHVNKNLHKDILTYSDVDQIYNNIDERCNNIYTKYQMNIKELLQKGEIYTFVDKLK